MPVTGYHISEGKCPEQHVVNRIIRVSANSSVLSTKEGSTRAGRAYRVSVLELPLSPCVRALPLLVWPHRLRAQETCCEGRRFSVAKQQQRFMEDLFGADTTQH